MVALASASSSIELDRPSLPEGSSDLLAVDQSRYCSGCTAGHAPGPWHGRDPRTTSSSLRRCGPCAARGRSHTDRLAPQPSRCSPQRSCRTEKGCTAVCAHELSQAREGCSFGIAAGSGRCTGSWQRGVGRSHFGSTSEVGLESPVSTPVDLHTYSIGGSGSGNTPSPSSAVRKIRPCTEVQGSAQTPDSRSSSIGSRLHRVRRNVGLGWHDLCSSPSSGGVDRIHLLNRASVGPLFSACTHSTSRCM